MKRAKIMLNGSVQGVGLRASIKEYADKLGLVGQVRNIENNGVEVICEGERDSIDGLISKLQNAPGLGKVDAVSVSYSAHTGAYESFTVAYGDMGKELYKATVAIVDELRNINRNVCDVKGEVHIMNDKMDVMNGKMGTMNDKMDTMAGKMDVMNGKMDVMNGKMGTMNDKMDTMADKMDVMNGKMGTMNDKMDVMNDNILGIKDEIRGSND